MTPNLGLRGINYYCVSRWSCRWLSKILYALNQDVLLMTAFYTRRYLLNWLNISLHYYWLLSLCCYPSRIIIACASWRHIVFHELFLKLCLLLSLSCDLFFTEIFIAIISISVKINRRPLPGEHVALLRWCHHYLLGWIFYNNLWHVLCKSRCLFVGIQGRITTWGCVVSTWVCVSVVKSLSWIQYLA